MKFKYRKIPNVTHPGKGWFNRPYLKVRLFNGAKHQDVLALVDSGADACLFHSSIADELGIDTRSSLRTDFGGIAAGEVVEAYVHNVEVQVEGFAERVTIEVCFADSDAIGGLLGGIGFFDNYKVTLEKYKGRFQVETRPTVRS